MISLDLRYDSRENKVLFVKIGAGRNCYLMAVLFNRVFFQLEF